MTSVPVFCLRPYQIPISCIKFKDENSILLANQAGEIGLYSLESHKKLISHTLHQESLVSVDVQENLCLGNYKSKGTCLYDIDHEFKELFSFNRESCTFCPSKFCSFDSNCILFPDSKSKNMCVADIRTNQTFPMVFDQNYGAIMTCDSFGHDQNSIITSAFENGKFVVWDFRSHKIIETLDVSESPVLCSGLSEKNKKIFLGTMESKVCEIDLSSYKSNPETYKSLHGISSLSSTNDGGILALGSTNSKILFVSHINQSMSLAETHRKQISSIDCIFMPHRDNNSLIACASQDGMVSFWLSNKLFK